MEMTILRAGGLTTVQDLGRPGHRAIGVPLGGAADPVALRLANLLVGNPENTAALECALVGPELVFSEAVTLAVGGAAFAGLPAWRPVHVAANEKIELGACQGGCRGYLAIAGGIAVEPVQGSRSTYVRAGLGGWQGRALRAGDILPLGTPPRPGRIDHWSVSPRVLPAYTPSPRLRVMRGAQADEFAPGWREAEFEVTPQFDRMGVRLAGPPLTRASEQELLSTAVAPGTVQVPPDGHPIILLADAQTIGGYPRLAHVIAVDLPLVAQLQAGNRVRFQEVSLEEAHRLWHARERELGILAEGLAQKFL